MSSTKSPSGSNKKANDNSLPLAARDEHMPAVRKLSSEISFCQLQKILRKRNIAITGGTIDLSALMTHNLDGTMVDPRKVMSMLGTKEIYYHLWVATKSVVDNTESIQAMKSKDSLAEEVLAAFLVELGVALLDCVPGPHLTFVNPKNYASTSKMVKDARRIHSGFIKKGTTNERVVISIPGTAEGAAAAKILQERYSIHTNITHITSLIHAIACMEAKPTVVSIPVGRILEWHEARRRKVYSDLLDHPGVEAIEAIGIYVKLHDMKTKLLGTAFRRPQETLYLENLDAVSLTKMQLDRLDAHNISTDSAPPPSWPALDTTRASFRARQAQYPTSFLSAKSGFTSCFSIESKSALSNVLYWELGRATVTMDKLENAVEEELARQLTLKFLDIQTLYGISPKRSKGKDKHRKDLPSHKETSKHAKARSEARAPQSLIDGLDYF
ncbi:hypothetical protein PC9H_000164 [Pleurotus ostreatus]|uniref:Transaldolase n=2 Tax=Pleurotus ostreatus TaxID=5322 RepID=A0A8H7A375_PLEOS|nr:uncharacterized protein PC9H_000164 [Pleurotus ostreatus]KAF7439827.1 hypothetical protein PC9H_000164 [Pleurotus ostreatus]KAJ8700998.1 hypothetical protein PTI98_003967 [Pleurotus ostreatus]